MNVFLVGPMGAGKSTIGRQLARDLRLEFFDSDQVIEERAGADITWIFDVEGEDGFRDREIQMIDELSQKSGIVLATGGGAICAPENRQHLAARGTVVYLHTSIAQQIHRTARDKRRPLVQEIGQNEAEWKSLMVIRGPLYEEIADVVVSTDDRTVRTVAQEIIRRLEEHDL
jgi:shikimate kinase